MTPLSFAQFRLWFLNRLEGAGSTYNVPLVLRLSDPPDTGALRAALNDLAERHAVLRTIYPEVDGEPHQDVWETDSPVRLDIFDVLEGDRATTLDQLLKAGFDLTREPPLRAALLRMADRDDTLVLVLHHIATDGWSMGPLLRDLGTAYRARAAGRAPDWAKLPVQYADYAVWQRKLLGDEADPDSLMSRQLSYWRKELDGIPDTLPLPSDQPRPAQRSPGGGSVPFRVPRSVHAELAELAHRTCVTIPMLAQTALAVLLTRVGSGTDIPIGTAVAGRDDEALDDLVGFFVNTLVLRIDTSGDPTLEEMVQRVRTTALAALGHRDVPFDRLVGALNPHRSLSHSPLFQVALTVEADPGEDPGLTMLGATPEHVTSSSAKCDLSFSLLEHTDGHEPAGMSGDVEFATDLFTSQTCAVLAERFVQVLTSLVRTPDLTIGEVDVLTPTEHAGLAAAARRADPAGYQPSTFSDLFEAQARRTPAAPALVDGDVHLDYATLEHCANRIARQLIAAGIGPEDIVGLALPRSAELVTAVLAVQKAGAAHLLLDLAYPLERLRTMIEDADVRLVLTSVDTPEAVSLMASSAMRVEVDQDRLCGAVGAPTDADRVRPLRPANPAYVIFTSGSTGSPKGVIVTHEGLGNLTQALAAGPGRRVLQLVSPSFDVFISEMCMSLLSGGALVMPQEGPLLADTLHALLRDERITDVSAPPAVFRGLPDGPLPELRRMLIGGEECTSDFVAHWADRIELLNCYGPTEATVTTTITAPLSTAPAQRPPIGRPLAHVGVHVLDAALRPVPAGVVGELYITGVGLARGYLGQPAFTAERFVACPFEPGRRMYRTGDLARVLSDGRLYFAGRVDTQVKLRGMRIETGEVEAVMSAVPGIEQAVVTVREDRPGDQRLVAHLTSADPLDERALRAAIVAQLPGYMVPSAFVMLDQLPLTSNGKIDRAALPAPRSAAPTGPRPVGGSPTERFLCGVFADLLGLPEVGPDDDFFALGGHSLLATQIVGRAREVLPSLSIRHVFSDATPAGLARLAERAVLPDGADGMNPVVQLRDAPHGGPELFCIHPVGGLSWCYAPLAHSLHSDVRVHGLQSPALRGHPTPSSVVDLADAYARRIRAVSPHGPYALLGWSLGGTLAYAIAARLEAAAAQVSALVLLDALPETPASLLGPADADAVPSLALGGQPAAALTDTERARLATAAETVLRLAGPLPAGPVTAPVLLVEAVPPGDHDIGLTARWAPLLAGPVTAHILPTNHEGVVSATCVPALVPLIDEALGLP